MATWPTALSQCMEASGFQLSPVDTTIRTEMAVGVPKVRPRSTDAPEHFSGSILMQKSLYNTLNTFYKVDLANGSLPFDWVHPISGDPAKIRFRAPPGYAPAGGTLFQVSLQFEVLP